MNGVGNTGFFQDSRTPNAEVQRSKRSREAKIELEKKLCEYDFYEDIEDNYIVKTDGEEVGVVESARNEQEYVSKASSSFNSTEEYLSVKLPLFFEEVKATLKKAKSDRDGMLRVG